MFYIYIKYRSIFYYLFEAFFMRTLIAALSLLTFTVASYAEADHVTVHAVKEATGSISSGDVASMTARFNVTISNTTDREIDLAKGCFILSNNSAPTKGNVFSVETIDEKLVQGKVSANDSLRGFAVFVGKNADILDAHFVHYLPKCINK